MFDVQIVGRKIGKLRKKCNLTQMELADRMGVSYQAVSNWERGSSMPGYFQAAGACRNFWSVR